MAIGFQNFFEATLTAPCTATDTTISLSPVPSVSEGYILLDYDNTSKREFIYFTSKNSTSVSGVSAGVFRGQDGTAASPHDQNAKVRMNVNAGILASLRDGTAIAGVAPGTITNAMVSPTAAISITKLDLSTATHVRAYVGASMAAPVTNAVVQFNTEEYDTLNEFNPATYTFTAANAGKYQIFARFQWGSAGASVTESAELNVQKNSADFLNSERLNGTGDASRILKPFVFATKLLAAGDTIRVVNRSTNGVRDITAGQDNSYLEIHRVG